MGFLLIVRTDGLSLPMTSASTVGYSEFPAYSQIYLRNYNVHLMNQVVLNKELQLASSNLLTLSVSGTRLWTEERAARVRQIGCLRVEE